MGRVHDERYELIELIASDRGELWRATDKKSYYTVAIRIAGAVDQHVAQVLSGINHPSIERIYAFGPDYLVVEDIGARPFAPIHYSASLVLRAFAQLAEGLRLVHDAGAAHGDIQSSDLIARSDGSLVLTGFGVASAVADDLERLGTLAEQYLSGTDFASRARSFTTFADFAAAALASAGALEDAMAAPSTSDSAASPYGDSAYGAEPSAQPAWGWPAPDDYDQSYEPQPIPA